MYNTHQRAHENMMCLSNTFVTSFPPTKRANGIKLTNYYDVGKKNKKTKFMAQPPKNLQTATEFIAPQNLSLCSNQISTI